MVLNPLLWDRKRKEEIVISCFGLMRLCMINVKREILMVKYK